MAQWLGSNKVTHTHTHTHTLTQHTSIFRTLQQSLANKYLSLFCRKFPIDMAGFAVHLCLLMAHPGVVTGKDSNGKPSKSGYLESNLLEQVIDRNSLECRGPSDEVSDNNFHVHAKSLIRTLYIGHD